MSAREAEIAAQECQDIAGLDESFITFEVVEDSLLSSEPPKKNSSDEAYHPRALVAQEVRANFMLQSRLLRPLLHGTVCNTIPAFLLRPSFTFQGQSKNWLSRISYAKISVLFEDAPEDPTARPQDPPAVKSAAFLDREYVGPTKTDLVEETVEVKVEPNVGGFSGIGTTIGTSRTKLDEGNLRIQTAILGRDDNKVTWTIRENDVSKIGIPSSIELPIIVMPTENRRFSAKITVNATYGFWQGPLAKTVPVLGKNDDPLYFDPVVLGVKEAENLRGRDGNLIIERVGELDIGSLNEMALRSFA